MLLRLLIIMLVWINTLQVFAQAGAPSNTLSPGLLPVRVPPSPTATAIERYALMPVNESSGTPSISIPLYEASGGQLPIALSLNYHASGIRVTDMASWVGLGWTLQAGGTITRVVRGNPDEGRGGFKQNYAKVPNAGNLRLFGPGNQPTADYTALERISQDELDYEPDLYTYNMQGRAGCFMLGNDNQYYSFPQQPFRITATDSAFTIVDEQGTQYLFADKEYSQNGKRKNIFIHSAWNLSRIVSADKVDTVRFEYEEVLLRLRSKQQQLSVVSSIVTVLDGKDGGLDQNPLEVFLDDPPKRTFVKSRQLRRILFRGGAMHFQVANRLDADDRQLQALHIIAANSRDTIRTIKFYHSYFNAEAIGHTDATEQLRLRLDSVATTSKKGCNSKLRWRPLSLKTSTFAPPQSDDEQNRVFGPGRGPF